MTDSTWWLHALLELAQQPTTEHRSPDTVVPPSGVLAGLDPITAVPETHVITAAMNYARCPHAEAEPQLLWARHARTAARILWGKGHPAAMQAAVVYHDVLLRQGLTFDAVRIGEEQFEIYRELGEPTRIHAARCGLALALHRDGQCDTAQEQIRRVLRQWWASPHGYGHATMVLLIAAAIHAGCGRPTEAAQLLTRDAAHLAHLDPADRHLAAQWLATVAGTHPSRCSLRTPAAAPAPGDDAQPVFWLRILQPPGALRPRSASDHRPGRAAS